MHVAVVQLNSQNDKNANLEYAVDYIHEAANNGASLIVLPEYTDYLGPNAGAREIAEKPGGPAHQEFARVAREREIWLVAGSIRVEAPDGRVHNTSLVFDHSGALHASYQKMHLFDVDIPDGVTHRESDSVAPGAELVTCDIDGMRLGLSVCYDLRFPELYRGLTLRGAEVLCVPAAFTFFTGRDHWEILLRARAIENQCYVVAAGQVGQYPVEGGAAARTNGRSMIVDPWGVVIACAPDLPGVTTAQMDRGRLRRIRAEVPSVAHRRPEVYGSDG